jgi:hypothetical protein
MIKKHYILLSLFLFFAKQLSAKYSVFYLKSASQDDLTISDYSSNLKNSNDTFIDVPLLNASIQKAEAYMSNNLYINPDYPILFAKYLAKTKNANIKIKNDVIKQLIQKKDICLLQALYISKYKCGGVKAEEVINNMLKVEYDSIGSLVLIGLHSNQLNKDKYNLLFEILAKEERDEYKITHLYYAIKTIEKRNKSFLTQRSKQIAQHIETAILPLYLKGNYNSDLYFETLAFITEFGNTKKILKEFKNLISEQNPDGGFSSVKNSSYSSLHPTLLALWYLLNIKNKFIIY